jgi:adenosine/AMP kinase
LPHHQASGLLVPARAHAFALATGALPRCLTSRLFTWWFSLRADALWIAEAVVGSVPGAKFGLAFCESSGDCLVRVEGNDNFLKALAARNPLAIGAGHSFILFLAGCFPINVLNAVKNVQEVCSIYCATANQVEVIIAESATGRGILGVIDRAKPKGVEGPDGVKWRTDLLRRFGYMRG